MKGKMKGKTILGIIGLAAGMMLTLALLLVTGGTAGQYHAGGNDTLICYDCHTIHFSMSHKWESGDPVTPGPPQIIGGQLTGDWIGTTGPNEFLLKAPANELCLSCHNGQTFTADVLGVNTNAAPQNGRQAGALNDQTLGTPYETWKGHTLGSTVVPPGYDPTKVGLSATWYDVTNGLECVSCHLQHGDPARYRNLGPRSFPGGSSNAPSYVIGNTNDTTKDVWINIPAGYVGGSMNPATFNPYYATANIFFNRNDGTTGSLKWSNRISLQCASCHANFHGGPGDATVGGAPGAGNLEGFLRHPTAQTTIGAAGGAGYGGHSTLSRYVGVTTKVKVTSDNSGTNGTNGTFTDASPFCQTCHKGHGNQNPFGLIFLSRSATSVDEQGGWDATQPQTLSEGYRNLCGQCHSQGN
jgi:hypothetical protein